MRVIEFNDIPHFHNSTQTVEHLGKLLGSKTHVMTQVIKLRKDLTFSLLTEGLKRVYSMEKSQSFTASEALVFEWKIDTTQVPRIMFVEDCTADGRNLQPFSVVLEKNFYAANDTFALENQQQLFVRQAPEQLGPNRWRYVVNLVGNNISQGVDSRFMTRGRTTQYRSNYHPELSERGSNKYTYNVEVHRGYLSRHRQSMIVSGDAQAIYFEVGNKEKGNAQYFYMSKPEKHLLDLFMLTRENSFIFGRSNHDVNGKCLQYDDTGRAIPMGDGIIAQIERYCDKFNYNRMTTTLFNDALTAMVRRTGKWMGNNITVVANYIGYQQCMDAIENKLRAVAIDGAYYYTKDKSMVNVGATYRQYEYNGNTITFTIDTALTETYDRFGFILFVDTSIIDGRPNISMFTLKGRELLQGNIRGMASLNGSSSMGDIATSIDGMEIHLLGYSGVAYMNPYSGFIMQENVY